MPPSAFHQRKNLPTLVMSFFEKNTELRLERLKKQKGTLQKKNIYIYI
jgi:hypothetical protein